MQWSSADCPGQIPEGGDYIEDGTTVYMIGGLEEYITYSITVTANNSAGSAISSTASARTSETGSLRL